VKKRFKLIKTVKITSKVKYLGLKIIVPWKENQNISEINVGA
jgi:hypothetical protein